MVAVKGKAVRGKMSQDQKQGRLPVRQAVSYLFRLLLIGAGAYCLYGALMPMLSTGRRHIGVLTLLVLGTAAVLIGLFYPLVRRAAACWWHHRAGRVLIRTAAVLLALFFLLLAVVSGIMLYSASRSAPSGATVIVLGASVRGNRASTMLADRLNAAVRYLEENPDSVCVVSGGQGENEERPEADVMREYLLDKGIADSRIYREDQSTSTYENIAFSKEIIEREGLCRTVVIATQEFHQYRGQSFARQAGFTDVGPLTCRSPEAQIASYWVREFFAIQYMWVFGYGGA